MDRVQYGRGQARVTTPLTGTDEFREQEFIGKYGMTPEERAILVAKEKEKRSKSNVIKVDLGDVKK